MKKYNSKFGLVGWLLLIAVMAMGAKIGDDLLRLGTTSGTDIQILMGDNGILKWDDSLQKMRFSNDGGSGFTDLGAAVGATGDPEVFNVGLSLSAGTLQVTSADGSALTGGNQAVFVMASQVTPGKKVVLKASDATHFLIDDAGASTIIGEEFGITSGIAWGEDRPAYLYAVNGDDSNSGLKFAISPMPNLKQSPATALIGFHATPMATPSDFGMSFLTVTDVTTTHDNVPVLLIGAVRWQMSAADDWTVSALSVASQDGISANPYVGVQFEYPTEQMGAKPGSHLGTSGTEPTWASPSLIRYSYTMDLDARVYIRYSTEGAGATTNGAGGQSVSLTLPYLLAEILPASSGVAGAPIGSYTLTSTSPTTGILFFRINGPAVIYQLLNQTNSTTILNTDFAGADTDMTVNFYYQSGQP